MGSGRYVVQRRGIAARPRRRARLHGSSIGHAAQRQSAGRTAARSDARRAAPHHLRRERVPDWSRRRGWRWQSTEWSDPSCRRKRTRCRHVANHRTTTGRASAATDQMIIRRAGCARADARRAIAGVRHHRSDWTARRRRVRSERRLARARAVESAPARGPASVPAEGRDSGPAKAEGSAAASTARAAR